MKRRKTKKEMKNERETINWKKETEKRKKKKEKWRKKLNETKDGPATKAGRYESPTRSERYEKCRKRKPTGLECHAQLNPMRRVILFDSDKGIFHEFGPHVFFL